MAEVKFQSKRYEWTEGESLLECLERNGEDIPNACRSGACHSCLVRVTEGPISPIAQLGLKEVWKEQRLCLSCVSTEPADVTVAPSDLSVQVLAEVVKKESLGRDVVRLQLSPRKPFPFRAGQFVNITRPDGLTRSYSVASIESDGVVELHVRVLPGGRMSTWVRDSLAVGHELSIRGPTGDCIYVDGRPDSPLLLLGTGTGLAPLVGIARDALARKHRGSITLVHGGRAPEDLYLDIELRGLAKKHPNFRYLPTLSQSEAVPGTAKGRVDKIVSDQFKSLTGFRVFLCGSPPMVKDARALAYKMGAALDDIHSDAFLAAPPPKPSSKEISAVKRKDVALPVLPAARPAPAKKFEVKQALALAVESGKVDAAFLPGASTYALLKRTKLGVDVLAQAQFHGATTYSGVLVAREGLKQRPLPSKRGLPGGEIKEAGSITEVETNSEAERLFGTRVAFVQMDSLSGYLAPVGWLSQHGVRMTDLGEVIFAQTHTRALSLLRSGRVDIAATFDRVLMEAQAEDPTFKPEILARFDGLPNALLVTRPGLPEERREKLMQVLTSVFVDAQRTQTKEALETGAAMDGLVPASVDAVREVGKWLE